MCGYYISARTIVDPTIHIILLYVTINDFLLINLLMPCENQEGDLLIKHRQVPGSHHVSTIIFSVTIERACEMLMSGRRPCEHGDVPRAHGCDGVRRTHTHV